MIESKDPRDIITSHAFEVAEPLIGQPLATPIRRAAALLIDVTIAAVLSLLGGGFLLLATAIVLFRAAFRKTGPGAKRRAVHRTALASTAVIALLATGWVTVQKFRDGNAPFSIDLEEDEDALHSADPISPEEVALLEKMSKHSLMPESASRQIKAVIAAQSSNSKEMTADDLAQVAAWVEAHQQNNQAEVARLQSNVSQIVAREELTLFKKRDKARAKKIKRLEDKNYELQERIDAPSYMNIVESVAEDLGLAIGWMGLYFILAIAWWNGQTVGKAMFKIRVINLSGSNLNLWGAIGRFGGYAAGLATGLLGFLQIFWDPNRQCIQDKISGTVVIDLRPSRDRRANAKT
ncbi:MAG: RDD family protein [Myxococcota bacterium]|nr:RDD family protein [Myxococcota bacterium]